jgi:SAM-dependent methyltransferase
MARARTTPTVYDTIGLAYTVNRQTEPAWAALIAQQLGDARRVANVGAGTGSYEPTTDAVATVADEPSAIMIAQRLTGAAPALRGDGSALPLLAGSLDAAMAILTIHHWDDWRSGLAELRRVAPRRLILTIDFSVHAGFWLLADYLPEVADCVLARRPRIEDIAAELPLTATHALPLPADMRDGVLGAHWRRPEAYLDPAVRANCSPLALADPVALAAGITRLEGDLASGAWHRRYAGLVEAETYDVGYRLLVSEDA